MLPELQVLRQPALRQIPRVRQAEGCQRDPLHDCQVCPGLSGLSSSRSFESASGAGAVCQLAMVFPRRLLLTPGVRSRKMLCLRCSCLRRAAGGHQAGPLSNRVVAMLAVDDISGAFLEEAQLQWLPVLWPQTRLRLQLLLLRTVRWVTCNAPAAGTRTTPPPQHPQGVPEVI